MKGGLVQGYSGVYHLKVDKLLYDGTSQRHWGVIMTFVKGLRLPIMGGVHRYHRVIPRGVAVQMIDLKLLEDTPEAHRFWARIEEWKV